MSKLAATKKETPLGCGQVYNDTSSTAEFDSFLTYGFARPGAMASKTVSVSCAATTANELDPASDSDF